MIVRLELNKPSEISAVTSLLKNAYKHHKKTRGSIALKYLVNTKEFVTIGVDTIHEYKTTYYSTLCLDGILVAFIYDNVIKLNQFLLKSANADYWYGVVKQIEENDR